MPIEPGNLSLGVLAGGLIGTVAGHYLTKSRNTDEREIAERLKAAASFRAAFAPTLAVVKLSKKHRSTTEPLHYVDSTIRGAVLRQAAEIELFRLHVPKCSSNAYQEAWDNYLEEAWNYGWLATTFRTDVDDPWKVFEDLIHDILRFADSNKDEV